MAAPVVQLRVPEDTLAAVDGACGDGTRSAWILALIERELTGDSEHGPAVTSPASPATSPLGAVSGIGHGEPSPGVVCMGPGCWHRNTARYGLRQLPLCPADAAALEGYAYQREIPPGAARLVRHGAA